MKKITLYSIVLSLTLPGVAVAKIDVQKINTYMHADLHVQSTPIESNYLRKYFDCTFYHTTVTKASGRSEQVSFVPDTIAVLPNGNVMSVSMPANSSRLTELERCLRDRPTSFGEIKELQRGLESLYPFMVGVVEGQKYKITGNNLTLVTAQNYRGVNEFNVILKGGKPNEIYIKYAALQ